MVTTFCFIHTIVTVLDKVTKLADMNTLTITTSESIFSTAGAWDKNKRP